MRKLTAFLCICMLLSATTAFATQVRVNTMGENDAIVADESNIMFLPQTLLKYRNLGIIGINGGAVRYAGCSYGLENYALALYWTEDRWGSAYQPNIPQWLGGPLAGLDQKLSLFYARELGAMPFGFSFDLYTDSHEKKFTADKSAESGMGLKIGVGLTLMEKLELGLKFGMLSWEQKNAAGDVVGEINGGTQIMLGARYWMEMSERYWLIPHFAFEMNSDGVKPPSPADPTEDSETIITLGIGNNFKPAEGILIVHDFGVVFASGSSKTGSAETEWSGSYLPYFKGGFEAPISDKFTFRFGGIKEWENVTVKAGNNEESWGGANTRFYIGAAYARDNFSIDMNFDPGFFERGPYLITGAPGAWAMGVDLKYVWGE